MEPAGQASSLTAFEILSSISERGLVSRKSHTRRIAGETDTLTSHPISGHISPDQLTKFATIRAPSEDDIHFNYFHPDIPDRDNRDNQAAGPDRVIRQLRSLVYEEQSGIYPVVLEKYPGENFDKDADFFLELTKRVQNSVCLILDKDTFQGKEVMRHSHPMFQVMLTHEEIRTKESVSAKNIKAVLAPLHLASLARQIFGDIVVTVEECKAEIDLGIMNDTAPILKDPIDGCRVTLVAPDYHQGLQQLGHLLSSGFYTHVVRLPCASDVQKIEGESKFKVSGSFQKMQAIADSPKYRFSKHYVVCGDKFNPTDLNAYFVVCKEADKKELTALIKGSESLQNAQAMSSSSSSPSTPISSSRKQFNRRPAIPESEFETVVTKKEFEALKTFWDQWASRPAPSNAPPSLPFSEVSKRFPAASQIQHLQALDNAYRSLVNNYHADTVDQLDSQEKRMRQAYPYHLSALTDMIQTLCLRDAFALGCDFPTYCDAYEKDTHPSFKIFQRYVNFFQRMLEIEQAPEIDNLNRLFTVRESEGVVNSLAFLRESDGWLPVPVNHSIHEPFTQAVYLHYGERVLPAPDNVKSHLIIIDGKDIVDQNGYVFELRKLPRPDRLEVEYYGYYGLENDMPYINTDKFSKKYAESDAMLVKMLSPYISNISSFLASREEVEVGFMPLPVTEEEQDEFTYCFLLNLLSELDNAKNDVERQEILLCLEQIVKAEKNPIHAEEDVSQPEKKPAQVPIKLAVAELIKEKEALIREDLRRKYDLQVQKEQELRSQLVIEGTTPGAGSSHSHRRIDKKEKSSSSKDPANKLYIAEKMERDFKAFNIHGPIKYRKLIRLARQMMKKNVLRFSQDAELPEMSPRINQRLSQQNIHFHGSKDSSVSSRSANRFCGVLVTQIRRDVEALVGEYT